MRKEAIKCPICRGGVCEVHNGTRDDDSIDVYCCNQCGTKFLSNLDKKKDYENGFMRGTDKLSETDIENVLLSCKKDDMRRFKMLQDMCADKNLLDFGCGYGGFLGNISKVTKSCKGVELGRCERDYLNKKGITCFKDIDEYNEKFDIITLFHVFEHLQNPQMWLKKYSDYLVDSGYLIIEVPNANDALLSLYESQKFADFTYWSAHLFLYTIKSLTMVIGETNLYDIVLAGQVQRYSIANHLMWLAKGTPGGHVEWSFLDTDELNEAYFLKLKELEMCDTLFFVLKKVKQYCP